MTLGKKLSCYRKLAGMTQQQLGTHLNLSAQAISKWEKDLAEPDLSTLRALAELYKVTVDELLDPNGGFPTEVEDEPTEQKEPEAEPAAPTAQTVGFCKRCGVLVNEESIGCTAPIVLCKKCAKAYAEEQAAISRKKKQLEEMEKKRRLAELEAKKKELATRRRKLRTRLIVSLIVASLAAAAFLGIGITLMSYAFNPLMLLITIVGTYVAFAFICCLFYDGIVQDVIFHWTTKAIRWPGLIFSFSLDGILWLIGMKILFFLLGALFGIVVAIIGVSIGIVCAPFAFPFQMVKVARGIARGENPDDFSPL